MGRKFMNVSNAVPWLALIVSVASALFTAAAVWISRERLRLDLYNRRFDVYSRTLDFCHALFDWRPTDLEKATSSLKDSPKLKQSQRAFLKASREAQFLFDDKSGIHKRLEQIHRDAIRVIGFRRNVAPVLDGQPEMFFQQHSEFQRSLQRIDESIPLLEQEMLCYLDFRSLSTWAFKRR
jgi:hypothetical protein